MLGDEVLCVRCGTGLAPSLDACLTCGQPGPWSADRSGDWSLQLGPITSQKFRDHAVEQLRRLDPHVDGHEVAVALKRGPVRVANNLTQTSAGALADAFGAQQTLAKAVPSHEPLPKKPSLSIAAMLFLAGVFTVLSSVIATIAVVAAGPAGLALAMLLMVALFGGVGALVLRSVRERRGVAQPGEALLSLPVSPTVPQSAGRLTERLFAAAPTRGDDADLLLEGGRKALRLLVRLSDPDDFAARIAGGADGDLGIVAADTARELVKLAEAGTGNLSAQDKARVARLLETLERAAASIDADSTGSNEDVAQQLEELVEAAEAPRAQ